MSGKFITIEGTEGAGKSTNLSSIEKVLNDFDISYIVTREPGGTAVGEELRSVLLKNESINISGQTELLLMFASRMQHINDVIKPALKLNKWVICDRFTDASYAYQGYGRQLNLSFISSLENLVHPDLQPDLTLILDVPVNIAMGRVHNRGNLDRFEKEDVAFFNRVRAGYKEIAKNNIDRCREIDASKDLAEVQALVQHIIRNFCKKQSNS
ncbi:MAG: dTMP kinase [Pseudomonadota bacterium]|nr:dTMP kinase [Pseudomonadota bacterium]